MNSNENIAPGINTITDCNTASSKLGKTIAKIEPKNEPTEEIKNNNNGLTCLTDFLKKYTTAVIKADTKKLTKSICVDNKIINLTS